MNNKISRPEILAPAGTIESLEAAAHAGADAVYVGGDVFSARAFAGNFDSESMVRAIDYCHLYGAKVYLAANTLMKDDEIEHLADYVRPFYLAGLDAVIVQDVGAAKVLRKVYPDLPLHASTQMSITSEYGAKLLKNFGFKRIVLARELSLAEIAEIKSKVDIEIETFVHGAMCYSYSGRCLFSSFLGGRSGNRGRCAQPCRKYYELENPTGSGPSNCKKSGSGKNGNLEGTGYPAEGYIMSLKDMCLLDRLPELIDAGIDSFKIEGRMKKPEYVAAAVNAYKTVRDDYLAGKYSEQKVAELIGDQQDIYNRGGFSHGYFFRDETAHVNRLNNSNCSSQSDLAERSSNTSTTKIQADADMITYTRPNHTGRLLGCVKHVEGAYIDVELLADLNAGDVLQLRFPQIEQTLNFKNRANSEFEGEVFGGSSESDLKNEFPIEITSAITECTGETARIKAKDLRKIKPGMEVYRIRNNALLRQIEEKIIRHKKVISAGASVYAHKGEPLKICIYEHPAVATNLILVEHNSATGNAVVTQTAKERNGESRKTGIISKDENNDDSRIEITLTGKIVEKAKKHPTTEAEIKEKMNKIAGTGLSLKVSCDIDDDIFIPMSSLNELRRRAVEEFISALSGRFHRDESLISEPKAEASRDFADASRTRDENRICEADTEVYKYFADTNGKKDESLICKAGVETGKDFADAKMPDAHNSSPQNDAADLSGITVRVRTKEQLKAVLDLPQIRNIILEDDLNSDLEELKNFAGNIFFSLPDVYRQRGLRPSEKSSSYTEGNSNNYLKNKETDAQKASAEYKNISNKTGILVKNIDELGLLAADGYKGPVIADFFLYAYNLKAVEFYREYFNDIIFIAPDELTINELRRMSVNFIYKVYGHQRLMTTAQRISNKKFAKFSDNKGEFFAVYDEGSHTTAIYNGIPTYMPDKIEDIPCVGQRGKENYRNDKDLNTNYEELLYDDFNKNILLDFTIESAEEVKEIITGKSFPPEFTRGHYYKGID